MKALIHRILYRTLPLEAYLRVVSRLFFLWQRLGIGRYAPATEYVYHLPRIVRPGDACIDIGANLGSAGSSNGTSAAAATSRSSPTPSAPSGRRSPWATIRRAKRDTSEPDRTS